MLIEVGFSFTGNYILQHYNITNSIQGKLEGIKSKGASNRMNIFFFSFQVDGFITRRQGKGGLKAAVHETELCCDEILTTKSTRSKCLKEPVTCAGCWLNLKTLVATAFKC